VSPRADERDAVVPTSLPTSFSGSFDPHAGRVSDRTSVDPTEGLADVSHLDARRCRIVGWQIASKMTVQTVLRALEVARLRRGAFHDALSFSLDRAHSDAGREDRASARHPEIGAVPSIGSPGERRHRTPKSLNGFDPAELVVGPGRGAGRDVSHQEAVTVSSGTWWWNPDPGPLSETLSRRPDPRTSSGPTRQTTTPKAREDSTVWSLEGGPGEPVSAPRRRSPRSPVRCRPESERWS